MRSFKLRTGTAAAVWLCAAAGAALIGAAAHAQSAQPAGAQAPAASTATLGPQEIVENSAKRMLDELDANRAMYAKDPAKLDALVANVLLPNFDTDYAARLVLGQTWRTASEQQRKRFVDAFYHSLLHNYGNALLNFTAGNFTVLPYRGDPGATNATVKTDGQEVERREGAGRLQSAQDGRRLEGMGRGHRRDLLRQELQDGFCRRDSAERPR